MEHMPEHHHFMEGTFRGAGSLNPCKRCILEHAAPDLLEALKCLLWSMETPDALNEHYMAMARTAIAKAGGDDHV